MSLDLDTAPTFERILPYPGRTAMRRMLKKPYLALALKEVASEMKRAVIKGEYKLSDHALLASKVRQLRDRINEVKSGNFFALPGGAV